MTRGETKIAQGTRWSRLYGRQGWNIPVLAAVASRQIALPTRRSGGLKERPRRGFKRNATEAGSLPTTMEVMATAPPATPA
jgi:hypothetical protein